MDRETFETVFPSACIVAAFLLGVLAGRVSFGFDGLVITITTTRKKPTNPEPPTA